MSAARLVDLAWRGRVAVVTLDNPATLNAMDDALGPRLVGALEALGPLGARAAVLTGAGGNFSAGATSRGQGVSWPPTPTGGRARSSRPTLLGGPGAHGHGTPALPAGGGGGGAASGAGLAWIAACDLAVVAADRQLLPGFLAIGLTPAAGATVNLPRALGLAGPGNFCWPTGRWRWRMPFAWGSSTGGGAGESPGGALALAGELARQPREALLASRRLLRRGLGPDYAPRLEDERQAVIAAADRPEFRERVMRFGRKKK